MIIPGEFPFQRKIGRGKSVVSFKNGGAFATAIPPNLKEVEFFVHGKIVGLVDSIGEFEDTQSGAIPFKENC